jgi:hypothetical protein
MTPNTAFSALEKQRFAAKLALAWRIIAHRFAWDGPRPPRVAQVFNL